MADEKLIYDLEGARLPYSVEAEQAVLGSIIIDPKCLNDIAVQMKSEYFYIPQHREIYSVMSSMYELSQTIDFVSLLEKLKNDGIYDEAGGKAYHPACSECSVGRKCAYICCDNQGAVLRKSPDVCRAEHN